MVGIGLEFFVQLPGESRRRVLLPAEIVGIADGIVTAKPEDADMQIEAGMEVLVYFNRKRDFVKQAARITEVQVEPEMLFLLETVGDTMSAESRECYRVSTVISDFTTKFGKEDACPILDVSATGFAVAAAERYDIANIVPVTLFHEDKEFSGSACIQSTRELRRGKIRYGVNCVADEASRSNLTEGVRQLSVAAQRSQLHRLAATG